MINGCGNCANYVWGDKKTPLPSECVTCTTTHVPNGQHPTPSHWKAKPKTNADRIRAMSDEELAERLIFWNDDWGRWETDAGNIDGEPIDTKAEAIKAELEWLKQSAED